MARTWVLRTETKGTGAQVVPLETTKPRSADTEPVFVPPKRRRREPAQTVTPAAPKRFKVIDVMTRQPLIEGASTLDTVAALKRVRSVVDVNVYVWDEERERWRLLKLADKRALWELARRATGDEG